MIKSEDQKCERDLVLHDLFHDARNRSNDLRTAMTVQEINTDFPG
jgi:hypothetical protein